MSGCTSASWRVSVVLSLMVVAAGCGTSDATLTIDDPSSRGDDTHRLTSSTSSTCPATQLRATYALGGTVILPWGTMNGYVLVKDESIVGLVATRDAVPCGATIVDTGGVIAPGLVDLHNHVAYNFIAPWAAPKLYTNRYQWADDAAYGTSVKTPYNAVKNAGHLCQAQKYGELRALMGGTTTIQGSIGYTCQNGWVRNVESYVFCRDHIRQNVLPVKSITTLDAQRLIAQFDAGTTKAYLVHLAEGVDDSSRAELDTLRTLGLLRKEVVAIHGTALDAAQLGEMGQAGMKLVWSPSSNLALYGATTDIPTALRSGLKVAISPDWTPSGSNHLLGELKAADRVNRERFGGLLSDQQLFEMATSIPAEIVGLQDKIGRIAPGLAADLVVVRANGRAPLRAVIEAGQSDVLLTVIGGQAMYGDTALLGSLGVTGFETLAVCGEARGLLVRDSTVTRGGTETLADVTNKLVGDGVTPWPLEGSCAAAAQTPPP